MFICLFVYLFICLFTNFCLSSGVDWRKEKNFIQKNGNPSYGGDYFDGQLNTFQIHVRNDVDQSIKFRETAPAIGPVVVVPKDVTAKVDYIDKDRTGKLTFEAVGEDSVSGLETKFLLNGLPEFVVDEQYLSPEGEFVVVHRNGHGWEEILQEMKLKMMRVKSMSNSVNNVGFASVENRLSGLPVDKAHLTSNDSISESKKVDNIFTEEDSKPGTLTGSNAAENESSIIGQQYDKLNNTGSSYDTDKQTLPENHLVSYNFTSVEINKNITNNDSIIHSGLNDGKVKEDEKNLMLSNDTRVPILSGNINMTLDVSNTNLENKNIVDDKIKTNNVEGSDIPVGNHSVLPGNIVPNSGNNTNITIADEGKVIASFNIPAIIDKSDVTIRLDTSNDNNNNNNNNMSFINNNIVNVIENNSKVISSEPDHLISSGVTLGGTVGGNDGVTTIGNVNGVRTNVGFPENRNNVLSVNDTMKLDGRYNSSTLKETENLIKPLHGEVNHYFLPNNMTIERNGTNMTSEGVNVILGAPYNNATKFSGKANMIQNLEFGNSFIVSLANLANEDATLMEGNSQTIYIPSKAAVSASLRGNGSFVFSAETKEGKTLKIDGEGRKIVKDAEMPATLIIHEDGNYNYFFNFILFN